MLSVQHSIAEKYIKRICYATFSTLLCWFSNVTSLKVTVVCNINGGLPNHVVILYQRTEKIQKGYHYMVYF